MAIHSNIPALENIMDRGDLQAIVHEVTESDTTEHIAHLCLFSCQVMFDSFAKAQDPLSMGFPRKEY